MIETSDLPILVPFSRATVSIYLHFTAVGSQARCIPKYSYILLIPFNTTEAPISRESSLIPGAFTLGQDTRGKSLLGT